MDVFSIFFSTKICSVFSLELPHRGNSNEYTQYTITINCPKTAAMGIFLKRLKVVNCGKYINLNKITEI